MSRIYLEQREVLQMRFKLIKFFTLLTLLTVLPFMVSCHMMNAGNEHGQMSPGEQMDIVDTAASAGSFNTLVTAIKAAGLVDTLKGSGPFTVFAPTDEAFSKLPEGTVENLLKPRNKEKLISILTYHVVSGEVTAEDVVKLNSADTVNGRKLKIKVINGKVMVDNATVVKPDIMASNGVLHVIDTVLIP